MFEDFIAIAKIATDQILLLINQINKRLQMTFQSQVISCYKCSNGIICNISFEDFVAFTKNATDQPLLLINRISKRFQSQYHVTKVAMVWFIIFLKISLPKLP